MHSGSDTQRPQFPGDIALQTIGLSREYRVGRGVVKALREVDILVRTGEFIAVVGPSGCGKSTLLNLLGGLDRPTRGTVLVEGQDLSSLGEEKLAELRRSRMGFLFQRHDLFPVLSAAENVEFPLLLNERPPEKRLARVTELLELVGLAHKAHHLPEELSGGEQQRIGIARSLANDPAMILADEPTGNLDSATAAVIVSAMVSLTHTRGLTLVLVTHDPEVARRAHRILRLEDGRLLAKHGGPA
jgi:putative ABC transport system ATP-binding protein